MRLNDQRYIRVRLARVQTAKCEQLNVVPDVFPVQHGDGCGCEGELYPYFVCAECNRLVPHCFGAYEGPGDYLNECCDDCAQEIETC